MKTKTIKHKAFLDGYKAASKGVALHIAIADIPCYSKDFNRFIDGWLTREKEKQNGCKLSKVENL